ncbi:restriction endonuclease subunit S [Actinocorallia longicatena]|uniref:restriction endonuclease subunit S n=1 Tax=Actinocorallia longicatena TaxID=111803 RepID=UPI0031D0DD00
MLNQKCVRQENRIELSLARRTDPSRALPEHAQLRIGDVLINSTGRGTLGRAAEIRELPESATADTHVTIVRPDPERFASGFAGLALSTRKTDFESLQTGSTNQTELSAISIASVSITLPPIPTQERIVEVIGAIDDHITMLDAEISALDALFKGRREELFARYSTTGTTLPIGEILQEVKRPITTTPEAEYLQIGIRSHGRGLFTKEAVTGESLGSKKVYWVEPGDLVINIVFAWEGAVAVVPPEVKGYCGSHRFPAYQRVDGGDIEFFRLFFSSKAGTQLLANCSPGGAGRNRTLNRRRLMQSPVGMPSAQEQERAIYELQTQEASIGALRTETNRLRGMRASLLSGLLDRSITLADAEREA